MRRKITVDGPDHIKRRVRGKSFASYSALVRRLDVGEYASISVREGKGKFMVFMGRGEIKKTSPTGYTYPTRMGLMANAI